MSWVMRDGTIINTDNTVWIDKALTAPYPANIWRIDSLTNDGKPYHLLLPGVASINLISQPQKPLIHIYDARTHNPSDYDGNGYAVVRPTTCEAEEELNGLYSVELTAPVDEGGIFKYLTQYAVLKVPIRYHDETIQQLFRINSTNRKMDSNGLMEVDVEAPHIFYDLNDKIVMDCTVGDIIRKMGDVNGDGVIDDKDYELALKQYMATQTGKENVLTDEQMQYADMDGDGVVDMTDVSAIQAAFTDEPYYSPVTGNEALWQIFDGVYAGFADNDIIFGYHSDITDKAFTEEYSGITLTAALLGADNAFVNRWGGELYRDNFRFSICKEREGSRETGVIRYGSNMTDIEFTADYSECITYLIAEDNFGNRTTVINPKVPCKEFPHHKYRHVIFNYGRQNGAQFQRDAKAYAEQYATPNVNVKVSLAKIYGREEYADFINLCDFEVGDRVIIHHNELDVNYGNLKIIRKRFDVLAQETISIEIGSFKDAISRAGFMSGTVSSGQSAADKHLSALQSQVDGVSIDMYITTPIATIDGKYLTTNDGAYIVYKEG